MIFNKVRKVSKKMLLAVFSDSHGNTEAMISAIEAHRPDAVLFLGDGAADAEKVQKMFPHLPFHIVCGNCDLPRRGREESLLLEFEGLSVFMAHGHRYGVKMNLDSFANAAYFSGANIGLYGHTHRAFYKAYGALQIMNPGSVGDRLFPTFGLIEIENGAASCKILDIKKENK